MKIGIITIQKSEVNFGACLQSFALWKYVSDLGHTCEVIDLLRPCHKDYCISPSFGENKKTLLCKINCFLHRVLKRNKNNEILYDSSKFYTTFNNKVRYSKQFKSVESLYSSVLDYKVLISGSDQIWNPNMPFINAPYFLTFASSNVKKISYASSFGIDKIPDEVKCDYRRWMQDYSHISTREESGAKIIMEVLGKNAQVVLDPVFLLKKTQWQKEMKPYKGLQSKKYVLLYMLKYDQKVLNNAKRVAKNKNLPLYIVMSDPKVIELEDAIQIMDIGPAEWLWLIDNADTMVTTSFHGTAFCLIFKTPFFVFIKKESPTNTRIEGLLTAFDLQNHIYDEDVEFIVPNSNILFPSTMDTTMERHRRKSIDYLKNAIEK